MECYTKVEQVLKSGEICACYGWCLTDRYDPWCMHHAMIKKNIEEGRGLPGIVSTHHCLVALWEAGFELPEERDLMNDKYGGW